MSAASPSRTRPPAVAGTFYPADPTELATLVDRLLDAAAPAAAPGPDPLALIAPHAGFRYSGPIAASAHVRLRPSADRVRRVVLLGPAHRVRVDALGTTSAARWRTPLGDVPIDEELRGQALGHPSVVPADRALAPEHSLEVHLPFLQRVLAPGWRLLPLIVGRARPDEVADVIDLVWDPVDTLVVVSTDLSHFHDQPTAARLDRATAESIVARSTAIGPTDACGAHPVRGLLELATRRDLDVTLLDLRSSADTQGDRSRVVGYASFALTAARHPAEAR